MLLEIRNCSVVLNARMILNDISFSINKPTVLSVLGPSGAGKTTLLRCLAGLQPHTGTIYFNQERFDTIPTQLRNIGLVDQQLQLFPHLSVYDNIAFPLRLRHWSTANIKQRVQKYAEQFGITQTLNRFPQDTSGGEQQRVALARALIYEPQLLLLDEPFGALDAIRRYELMHWLRELLQTYPIPIVFVTHDIREAKFLATQTLVLDNGQSIAQGNWTELEQHNNVTVQQLLQQHF